MADRVGATDWHWNQQIYKENKMSKLKAITPEQASKKLSKPKIIVFGKAGVGKTYAAIDFPNCYYIDTEGGAKQSDYLAKLKKANGVYFGQDEGSQDFAEVTEQVKALATEKHNFKTLVIDSFSHLQMIEVGKEIEKFMKSKKDLSATYGAEKKPFAAHSRSLINWLDKLDMTVILICHEKQRYEDSKADGFMADSWDKMEYLFNLVLRITKKGGSRYATVEKTRFSEMFAPAEQFEWSYKKFAEKYGANTLEQEATPTQLATPEQLTELSQLLKQWQTMPQDWEQKVLASSSSDDWKDMQFEKMASTINFIKGKINGN